MKNQQQAMEVGTILVSQWGYEQTNVDFYEVVKAAKTMVTVRPIAMESKPEGWCQSTCMPVQGKYTGEAFRKKVKNFSASNDPARSFIELDFGNAYIWSGEPAHATSWA